MKIFENFKHHSGPPFIAMSLSNFCIQKTGDKAQRKLKVLLTHGALYGQRASVLPAKDKETEKACFKRLHRI